MRSLRLAIPLLVTGSFFAFTLPTSTASAAQSPACATASAAKAAKSPDYPRLQKICSDESRRPPRRPAIKPTRVRPAAVGPVMVPKAANTHPPQPRPSSRRKGSPFKWMSGGSGAQPGAQAAQPAAPPQPAAPAAPPAPRRPGAAPAPVPAPAPAPAAPPAPAPAAPELNAVTALPPSPGAAVAPERARAAADGARVFGLRLGDELRMPTCSDDATRDAEVLQSLTSPGAAQRRLNQSCRFAPGAMNGNARLFAQRLANVTADPLPAGVDFALVAVAAQRCPDWVNAAGSCVAGITTKDARIIGISYLAGDETHQASIEKSLSEKYTVTPRAQSGAPCQDPKLGARVSTTRTWEASGVRVSYFPTGGLNCRQGRVLVESEDMRRLLTPGADKRQASDAR